MSTRRFLLSLTVLSALTLSALPAIPVQAQVPCPTTCTSGCNLTTGQCLTTSSSGASGTSGSTGINTAQLTTYKTGVLTVINTIITPILIAIAFIVFLYGVAQAYIISGASEDARERGNQIIIWGILGFVVIFSVWGLVNIVMQVFGLSAGGSAATQNLVPPTL